MKVSTFKEKSAVDHILVGFLQLSTLGLALPCIVSIYWMLQIADIPEIWPAFLFFVVYYWVMHFRRSCEWHEVYEVSKFHQTRTWVFAVTATVVFLPLLLQTFVVASEYALNPNSTHFSFLDNAYTIMIAKAIAIDFPPPDLSYAGELLQYHYGLPLLLELLHRITTLDYHIIYYSVLPAILKIFSVSAIISILKQLFPSWNFNRILIAILMSETFIVIDFYNLLWYVNHFFNQGFNYFGDLFTTMPILSVNGTVASNEFYDGTALSVIFCLILISQKDNINSLVIGLTLFSIYLAKQQVFLVFFFGWFALIACQLFFEKEWIRSGVGAATAIALILISKKIIPFEAGFSLEIALNDYLYNYARRLMPMHPKILSMPLLALLFVIFLNLLGTHFYLLAFIKSITKKMNGLTYQETSLIAISISVVLASLALLTITRLVFNETVAEKFDVIYTIIDQREKLWMPLESYRENILNISLIPVFALTGTIVSVIGTGVLLNWHKTTHSKHVKSLITAISTIILALGVYEWEKRIIIEGNEVVRETAVEALSQIKDSQEIIMTNDLNFTKSQTIYFQNMWAPQLFGQQFYASNMRYSFIYTDSAERAKSIEKFWFSEYSDFHHAFLQEKNIEYLFIRRNLIFPREILEQPWTNLLVENEDYYLVSIQLKDKHGKNSINDGENQPGRSHENFIIDNELPE